jgi:hypothetical protein
LEDAGLGWLLSSRSWSGLGRKFAICCSLGCTVDEDAGVSRYPRPSHRAVVHDVTSDILPHMQFMLKSVDTSCGISDFRMRVHLYASERAVFEFCYLTGPIASKR